MVKVTVKWNKEIYKDVEIDEDTTVEIFQAQIFALSGVPPEGQKLLNKGKMIKADTDVQNIKDKSRIMLMGTATKLKEPEKQTVFLEDMTQEEKTRLAGEIAGGLHNLGNTCYMNSTLQCLRAIPELKQALSDFASPSNPANHSDPTHTLTAHMGRLFKEQDACEEAVFPHGFTHWFRTLFPQFAEQSPQGGYMQQDADECLVQLFSCLSGNLKNISSVTKGVLSKSGGNRADADNVIDYLFGGKMLVTMKCDESESEPATTDTDNFRKLRCHIDIKTNFMYQGVLDGLSEKLEKRSPSLGRNAMYTRQSKITELPRYIVVQFVRFGWRDDTKKKAKVLRRVQYPAVYDMSDCCEPKLKASLMKARREIMIANDKKLGGASLFADDDKKNKKNKKDKKDEKDEKEEDTKMEDEIDEKDMFEVDSTGNYAMIGVVTHKGRTGDSGHYVGWAKTKEAGDEKGAEAEWAKFDDEKVSSAKESDALNLAGGGDWHMSYLLFYRRIDDAKEFREQEAKTPTETETETKTETDTDTKMAESK